MKQVARKPNVTLKGPLHDCGEIVEAVDPERLYIIVRGDEERRVFIDQPWWCKQCQVGVEQVEIYEC